MNTKDWWYERRTWRRRFNEAVLAGCHAGGPCKGDPLGNRSAPVKPVLADWDGFKHLKRLVRGSVILACIGLGTAGTIAIATVISRYPVLLWWVVVPLLVGLVAYLVGVMTE